MQHSFSRIFPLYAVIFFGFLGYSLMITLFTPMFMYAQGGILPTTSSLEYRVIVLGLVLALFPLAQFFGSPILGAFSDRFGRRPILLFSLYVAPVCYALIALALTMHSLTLLMIGSLIAGASQGNIVIAQSAIADVASREERGRLFGYIYLSTSLAYMVGPLLGGKLAAWSYAAPFWAVCILLTATLIWIQCTFHETKKEKEWGVSFHHAITNLLTIFTSKKLRILYLVNFLIYFAIFGFFRSFPMYIVNRFHVSTSTLSEYIAWVSVPIILVNLGLTGPLSKRFSPRVLALWSGFFTGLFMLFIIIPHSANALWTTLFLTSAPLALSLPAYPTMLSLAASHAEQGRVMGNNQSLQVAAEALSAFSGGLLASIAIQLSLMVFALIACATAGLIFLMRRRIPDFE